MPRAARVQPETRVLTSGLYDIRLVCLVSHHVSTPLFVTGSISQFDRGRLELARSTHVDVVLLERPPLGEDRMHRRLGVGRIFHVASAPAVAGIRDVTETR